MTFFGNKQFHNERRLFTESTCEKAKTLLGNLHNLYNVIAVTLVTSLTSTGLYEADQSLSRRRINDTRYTSVAVQAVVTMSSFARKNKATDAEIDTTTIFASGAFKNVYKGKYTKGERAGEECVCKIFKSESVFEESYFQVELKVVAKALEIVNRFNRGKHINQKILLNEPDVWTFTAGNKKEKKALIEPMITNFEKFNSNSGWTPKESSPWINAMQALSHFSYHTTNRRALLCDLQGGIYKDGFVLTDPVIISTNQEYGPTDLGVEGISTFFASHRCNQYCKVQWLVPHDKKKHVNVQKSTAMVLPNRQSRAALNCQLPGLSEN